MTTESDLPRPHRAAQKPRLVLMGEFSSGKSTLSNLLLGEPMLPTQITATRLPPVHVSHGVPGAYAMTLDGVPVEVDLTDLGAISPDRFRSLHLTMPSETLELCDLVDMPGISDPNLAADTWDALVGPSDHVIWCTHATQAWRQSEAAAWDRMRPFASGLNLLLVTQFDKLRNPRDRNRVLHRVIAETEGKFSGVFPVSLLEAIAAGDDFDAWQASGAHAVMERLVEILIASQDVAGPDGDATAQALVQVAEDEPVAETLPFRAEPFERPHSAVVIPVASPLSQGEARVTPRRVQARPGAGERPRRSAGAEPQAWSMEAESL